jgi:hypothetical protein
LQLHLQQFLSSKGFYLFYESSPWRRASGQRAEEEKKKQRPTAPGIKVNPIRTLGIQPDFCPNSSILVVKQIGPLLSNPVPPSCVEKYHRHLLSFASQAVGTLTLLRSLCRLLGLRRGKGVAASARTSQWRYRTIV